MAFPFDGHCDPPHDVVPGALLHEVMLRRPGTSCLI
jgi:hypothetical protein